MKYLILGCILNLAILNGKCSAYGKPPRAVRVNMEYLQACEEGKDCPPILISRKKGEKLKLALPDMFRTSVTMWDEENYNKLSKHAGNYHPIQSTGTGNTIELQKIVLTLSKLKDGTYYVWIAGDSVGGRFKVQLKTE
jgi:hypothetical protein